MGGRMRNRRLVASSAGGPRRRRWRRLPTALVALGCVAGVAAAITGAASPLPGLNFLPQGHWVYNTVLQLAVHVDGATKNIDGTVSVPGDPGSQVVQGDSSGYVVGRYRITVFGKSSLSVESQVAPPSDEVPLAIEALGGPYLVYRAAGKLVRLGDTPAVIPADAPLADPVITKDGTVWLYKPTKGLICSLGKDSATISYCPAPVDRGHTGSLTVVGDQPQFLDTTAGALIPVTPNGFGPRHPLGVPVSPQARPASSDVDGRVAILEPATHSMQLVDPLDPATAPVKVTLPDGDYDAPASTGSAVAVVDRKTNTVRTFDSAGQAQDVKSLPKGAPGGPRLSKGEDNRVYVESAQGTDVVVVGQDGKLADVRVVAKPETKGDEPAKPDPGKPAAPDPDPTPDAPEHDNRVVPAAPPASTGGPSTDKPQPPPPPATPDPPMVPVVPPSPPGAPSTVSATPGAGSATVSWGAAADNRATITGYRVSWASGSKTVGAGTRRTSIPGLTNGTRYTFSVSATNVAGRGPSASANPVTPAAAPDAPGGLNAAVTGADADLTWTAPNLAGGTLQHYAVSGTGLSAKSVAGTSASFTGLVPNSTVTFTVKAVTRTADGRTLTGAAASRTVTVPGGPALTVSRGDPDCPDYDEPGCAQMHVQLTGFEPNTRYNIMPHSDDPGYSNPGSGQTTDDTGAFAFDAFQYFGAGHLVWVSVDTSSGTITSPKIRWE
jgi:hypothetical protein